MSGCICLLVCFSESIQVIFLLGVAEGSQLFRSSLYLKAAGLVLISRRRFTPCPKALFSSKNLLQSPAFLTTKVEQKNLEVGLKVQTNVVCYADGVKLGLPILHSWKMNTETVCGPAIFGVPPKNLPRKHIPEFWTHPGGGEQLDQLITGQITSSSF